MSGMMLTEAGLTLAAVFVLTVLIARVVIPILKSHKAGVRILEIGPRWHKSKEGTPIMGGICFILAILITILGVTVIAACRREVRGLLPLALTLVLAVGNGLIGFADDFCKLVKKQNEGLLPWQKTVLQLLIGILYLVAMARFCSLSTALYIPYVGIEIELGIFYYVFALIVIIGFVNSVNLTDGVEMEVLSIAAPVVFDKLAIEKNKLWNECMTFLGINNANMDKRERLVDDEVQANNEQIGYSAEVMLKSRQRAAAAMSKLCGCNITVELRKAQKQQTGAEDPKQKEGGAEE